MLKHWLQSVDGHLWNDDGCKHVFREEGYDCANECGYSEGLVNILHEAVLSYGGFDAGGYCIASYRKYP